MIRYFFDLVIDEEITVDEEGVVLPSTERARHEASLALAEAAHDQLRSTQKISSFSIVVRTSEGPISEAFFHLEPKSVQ